ncbi:hypothetical protein AEM51_10490 [Bacteroidetes bacterium UKL13-3]|jgi:hypothetical protein|nr:hypothetical protein AEM51_10490 [Bacteroidetes bacterium UKL13-3]HCP93225.1 hypothetical protein [Bacteroidota bacterium]
MYKLDRTAFKIQTFEESNDDIAFWKSLTTQEIFEYGWLLTCQSFKIDALDELKLDRTVFEMRKNG